MKKFFFSHVRSLGFLWKEIWFIQFWLDFNSMTRRDWLMRGYYFQKFFSSIEQGWWVLLYSCYFLGSNITRFGLLLPNWYNFIKFIHPTFIILIENRIITTDGHPSYEILHWFHNYHLHQNILLPPLPHIHHLLTVNLCSF